MRSKYEKNNRFIFNKIIEVKVAKKRSPATMKIIIDDDLARLLVKDLNPFSSEIDNHICGLTLSWGQLVNNQERAR